MSLRNRILAACAAVAILTSVALFAAASKPKSVIHIITVKWKDDAKPEQIQAALKGVETAAASYSGIKNIWLKPIKMQLPEGYKQVIVMEFESEAALTKWADSDAQKKWYETYMKVRDESRTHDVTN